MEYGLNSPLTAHPLAPPTMGTRHLTIVRIQDLTKVAQYGQWDGYPTGQGNTIAAFLKAVDLPKFKEQIQALGVYTEEEIKQAYIDAGAAPDGEWISMEVADRVKEAHPALSRDHGAGILHLIHDGVVTKVLLKEDFKNDNIWCEYYYIIDLDKETVSMNGGKEYTFEEWKAEGLMEELERSEDESE